MKFKIALFVLLLVLPISCAMEYSVNVVSSGIVDNTANADIPVSGTVTGNYTLTYASDDRYEAIEELAITTGAPSGRKSYLEHKWTINVASGNKTNVTFYLEANHTVNTEGDDFVFAYSTNDINYTDMVNITKTLDDDTYQTFEMPGTISGPIYIRVMDANRTPGNTVKDTIYIDCMFIRSITDTAPPAKVGNVTATALSESRLNISWKANTEADLDHYNVYRSTVTGSPGAGSLIASPKINYYADTGLTANTTYYYRVSAVDAAQNKGIPSDEASGTTLLDRKGSATSNLVAAPNPTKGTSTVNLTANINDSASGNSTITAAEYFINTTESSGTGTPMSASDGKFDSQFEKVAADINVSGWAPRNYTLYVHGRDSAGNWGDTASTVLEVTELANNTMHVHSIDMSLGIRTAGKNSFTHAEALVTIVDASGAAVVGAAVSGTWSGVTNNPDLGRITDAAGQVTLESDEVKNAPDGTTFTVMVDGVVLAGWTYDPAANVETNDSITVDGSASSSSASGGLIQGFLDYVSQLLTG